MYDDPSTAVPGRPTSTGSAAGVAPGWYDDPHGRFDFRYHNGQRFTPDVSSSGQRFIDPLGVAPTPSSVAPPPAVSPHVAAALPPGWIPPPPTPRHPARSMAVQSMVFGLIGVVLAVVPFLFVIGALSAIAALVLGIVARRRIARSGATVGVERTGRGKAVAGIVLAPIALALCTAGFVFTRVTNRELDEYQNPGPLNIEITSCSIKDGEATALGTITNLDDRTRSYAVVVEFRDEGERVASERVEIDDVAPSDSASVAASRTVGDVAQADLTCTTRPVKGPYPFDLSPAA